MNDKVLSTPERLSQLVCCKVIFSSLVLWFFCVAAQASPIVNIVPEAVQLTSFPIEYFIDDSKLLDYQSVRKEAFQKTTSTTTLGTQATVTWYRITLYNSKQQDKNLFLNLPKAYHVRSIQIVEERSKGLTNQTLIDLNQASDHPLMYRGAVVYPFVVPAGETTVLYVRSHVYSHQWFSSEIYDDAHSRRALVGGHLDIALLVGMMLALVFYNGLLYFATSRKENILYSLYLISGLTWIALSYGLISKAFNVYGDSLFILNLSVFTMPIFLLLFMMAIFETRKFYPKEHRALQGVLVLLVASFLYGLVDIAGALKPATGLASLMMVVTFSVSISLLRKRNPLAKFFLIGHTFFIIFNGFAVMYYMGFVKPNYINSHGVGIGIVLEALTLAFIISYRIKVLEDIRSKQDELKKQASTDPLTQLYNRRYFIAEGRYMVKKAKANETSLSVLTIDIDHFKAVNDNHGHNVGDLVLIGVAGVFQRFSRDKDLIARFGGEEFVILLPEAGYAEALECAERIREGVEKHSFKVNDGLTLQIRVSIGVARVDVTTLESLESAIDRADKALYQAKSLGRNRVCGTDSPSSTLYEPMEEAATSYPLAVKSSSQNRV